MRAAFVKYFSILMAALVLTCALSVNSNGYGQGRGRGRGQDKKSEKFINGHDARDGRWDGRGPRVGLNRLRWSDQVRYRNRSWVKRNQKSKKIRGVYKHRR